MPGDSCLRGIIAHLMVVGSATVACLAAEPTTVTSTPEKRLLQETFRLREILEQALQTEIDHTLQRARAMMPDEPNKTIDLLKLLGDGVRRSPDLSADARTRLGNQISVLLMEASRRKSQAESRDLQHQLAVAESAAQRQLAADLRNREARLAQWMARFENLMDGRRFADAADVASLAGRADAGEPIVSQALGISQFSHAAVVAKAVQTAAHSGLRETLSSADRAAIPTMDDPPLMYPDAQVWRLLTERRIKYRNVDLASKHSDNEKRIIEALGKKTSLENLDQIPLIDVLDIIKRQHQIPIVIDARALAAAGIREDALVSINVRNITLRSGLRLLLRALDLTYLIKDEVLQITTLQEAQDIATNGVTKVYPVADFVVPIPQGGLTGFGGLNGSPGGIGSGMGNSGGSVNGNGPF